MFLLAVKHDERKEMRQLFRELSLISEQPALVSALTKETDVMRLLECVERVTLALETVISIRNCEDEAGRYTSCFYIFGVLTKYLENIASIGSAMWDILLRNKPVFRKFR